MEYSFEKDAHLSDCKEDYDNVSETINGKVNKHSKDEPIKSNLGEKMGFGCLYVVELGGEKWKQAKYTL